MNEHKKDLTFEDAGTRPIESISIEIADTFEDGGIHPIAQSPDYLVPNQMTENSGENDCKSETSST